MYIDIFTHTSIMYTYISVHVYMCMDKHINKASRMCGGMDGVSLFPRAYVCKCVGLSACVVGDD